jgi:predicted flap endonuclease-1-like 5' DNA nuclease
MEKLLDVVPFGMWLALAAILGGIAVWVFWRFQADQQRGWSEAQMAQRDSDRADAQAERARLGRPKTLAVPASRAESRAEETAQPDQSGHHLINKEMNLLRRRAWALERRMRSVIAALRKAEPPNPTQLVASLNALDVDGAPLAEISALKYRNWLLENQLARAREVPQPQTIERGAAPEDGDPAAIHRARNLVGDGSGASLRYRNWLLSSRLGRVLDCARAGHRFDPDAIETALKEATWRGFRAEFFAEPAEPTSVSDNALAAEVDALRDQMRKLSDENAGLRYRRWFLCRQIGELLRAAQESRKVDANQFRVVLERAIVESATEPALLDVGAVYPDYVGAVIKHDTAERGAAAPLLLRISALEQETRRLRAKLPMEQKRLAAVDEAASLRHKLRLADKERRRLIEAAHSARIEVETTKQLLNESMATPPEPPVDNEIVAQLEAMKSRELRMRHVGARLRRRLWSTEWRDRSQKQDVVRLQEENQRLTIELTQLAHAHEKLREERSDAQSVPDAEDLATKLAALADDLDTERRQRESLENQREQARKEKEKIRAERDDWRAKYEQTRQENNAEIALLMNRKTAASTNDGAFAQRFARAGQVLAQVRRPRGLGVERTRPQKPESARRYVQPVLDAAKREPLSDAEDGARDLIAESAVVALSSNRPRTLFVRAETDKPKDDLKLIEDIDDRLEARLNGVGVYYFDQITNFGAKELAWLDDRLSISGRTISERWSAQARRLSELRADDRLQQSEVDGAMTATARTLAGLTFDAPVQVAAKSQFDEPPIRHPDAVEIKAPLWPVETAAMALSDNGAVSRLPHSRPALFLRDAMNDDDLTRIGDIGPKLAQALLGEGIRSFEQIAQMSASDAAWLDRRLELDGRLTRERWIPQAHHWLDARAREAKRAAVLEIVPSTPAPRAPIEPGPHIVQKVDKRQLDAISSPEDIASEASRLLAIGLDPRLLAGRWPLALAQPKGVSDDLKLIKNIGPKLEAKLDQFGIFHFRQLAKADAMALAVLDTRLNLNGAVLSDNWLKQALAWDHVRRKGGLLVGGEGRWTTPSDNDGYQIVIAAARDSAYSSAEEEAIARIDRGVEPDFDQIPDIFLDGPDKASPDPLSLIHGIGARHVGTLNDLGVFYFKQLATMRGADLAWLDAAMGLNGAVLQERWAAQAAALDKRRF